MVRTHPSTPEQRAQWTAYVLAHQGEYGIVTHLSRAHGISRPTLYGWRDQAEYTQACLEADAFNRGCQLIVHSAQEEARRVSEGWRESPAAALAEYEAQQKRYADAAAEAAYAAQRMTQKAKDELR